MKEKIQLHGFNNLTKTLSFNMYDVCYAPAGDSQTYLTHIDEQFNSARLTSILSQVTQRIGATILNVAQQDYEPQGSSVTMMIAEESIDNLLPGVNNLVEKETIVAHLDKSHVTVHTYPETHPHNGISTFRADIDVATCGVVSPLNALNFLINSFESDIVTLDYRVRGFTRDVDGKKYFMDHDLNSIQDCIHRDIKSKYQMVDYNVYEEKLFHTKMMLKDWNLENYLFGSVIDEFSTEELNEITLNLKNEINEVFNGRNLVKEPIINS